VFFSHAFLASVFSLTRHVTRNKHIMLAAIRPNYGVVFCTGFFEALLTVRNTVTQNKTKSIHEILIVRYSSILAGIHEVDVKNWL